jgi:hypothetical protein
VLRTLRPSRQLTHKPHTPRPKQKIVFKKKYLKNKKTNHIFAAYLGDKNNKQP